MRFGLNFEPDYWHMLILFGIHTTAQFCVTYFLLNKLPKSSLAQMPLPISFEATQVCAGILQSLVSTNRTDIYVLLLSSVLYCQLWFIPLTWVFALLCGACMPSIIVSCGSTHLINIIGVTCNFYLSKIFLTKLISKSERMQAHLSQIETQLTQMGSGQIVFGMISLRIFPGSPNPLYNILFPHIPSITLKQNLIGVLVGQLPYNLCVVKAG